MKKQENSLQKVTPSPRFHMEIEGTGRSAAMLVYGVRHIEEYTSERIVFLIPGARMRLCGSLLSLSVFENKCVEIRGRLSEVGFSYDRT